jgi:hypothetical protein
MEVNLRMSEIVTTELMHEIGRRAIRLADTLSWKKAGERWLHGVVLGLLEAKIGHMQIEVQVGNSKSRVDFRHGGSNQAVIELAVRHHGPELYGPMNSSELRKLCKFTQSKAKRRVLLLLDPSHLPPIEKSALQKSYNTVSSGRGRFSRKTVTIVYVHADTEYSFQWRPL